MLQISARSYQFSDVPAIRRYSQGQPMPVHKILLVATEEVSPSLQQSLAGSDAPEVLLAHSPAEAISQLDENSPEVILLHEHLAASIEVATLAERARKHKPPTVLILIVGRADSTAPHQDYGAAGIILAPFDPSLREQIDRIAEEAWYQAKFADLRELGGDEFVQEMVELFIDLAAQKITEAEQGLQAGDLRTVMRAVHSLKSGAANVGAERVRDLAARIELLADQGNPETLPGLLAGLKQALEQANVRLQQLAPGIKD